MAEQTLGVQNQQQQQQSPAELRLKEQPTAKLSVKPTPPDLLYKQQPMVVQPQAERVQDKNLFNLKEAADTTKQSALLEAEPPFVEAPATVPEKPRPLSREPRPHVELTGRNANFANLSTPALRTPPTASLQARPFDRTYATSATSLRGTRVPTVTPVSQASLRTSSRADTSKNYYKGLSSPRGIHEKISPKVHEGEEAKIIGAHDSSTSRTSLSARENLSPLSRTYGSKLPSTHAFRKLPPVSSRQRPTRATYSLFKQSAKYVDKRPTTSQRVSHEKVRSSDRIEKRGEVPSDPRGRSMISFNLKRSRSKLSASSKKSSSYYTTSRSTDRSRSTGTRSTFDGTQVVVRTAEQSAHRNAQQESGREKILYPAAVCLAFVLTLVLCFLFWPTERPPPQMRNEIDSNRYGAICSSGTCMRRASYLGNILSWRDVKPCDHFDIFVCGQWRSRFTSAASYYSTSTDDDYVEFLEEKVHSFLQDGSQSPKVAQPLKFLHDECMNLRRIDYEGVEALKDLMARFSLKEFPLRTPTGENLSVWRTAAQLLRKTGTAALLAVDIASHPAVKGTDVVALGLPEVVTSFGYVESSEVIRLYTEALFSAIKIVRREYVPPGVILAVARFASNIEKLVQEASRETKAQIERLESRADLQEFVSAVLQGFEGVVAGGAMSDVLLWSPEATHSILDLVASTETQTVMNYLGLRLMVQASPFTPYSKLLDLLSVFIYGETRMVPPRWRLCVRVVERALRPLTFASAFAQSTLRKSISNLTGMIGAVLVEVRNEMDELPYIAYRSKHQIREILSTSEVRMFGPSWANHAAPVTDYVKNLPDVTNSRWGLDTFVAYHEHTFFKVLTRGSRMRWSRSVFSVDCWYETHPRSVYVPLLAFNLSQALDEGSVDALQLSRLGPRLSRCLFDMLIDEAGSANSTASWLNDNTRMKLLAAEACLDGRRDYLHLARFRDVLATRVAFRVFLNTTGGKDGSFALMLPDGRVMSGAQVFFAYLMLQYCERNEGPSQMRGDLASAVWGATLRNSVEFSGAYNCSHLTVAKNSIECETGKKLRTGSSE
ncbi:hypothetical protein HPB50_010270 [Hyalomma asiaticum]|uniref:Uncharacterized protein n=1 Tax=Hyalomma asiaticum TaxID=266040 RepID=A0ACB7SXN2_HYAAI|nr:hypothetical protein HPB50_010270 [Hyalomma asiaticum]